MFKKKLKELHMANSSRETEQIQSSQLQGSKKVQILSNERRLDNFSKRNLPELKLSKLKSHITSSEVDLELKREEEKKNIDTKKQKSKSLIKKKEIIFPQINKKRFKDFNSNIKPNNPNQNHSLLINNNHILNSNVVNIHKIKPNIPVGKPQIHPIQKNKNILNKTAEQTLTPYHPFPMQNIINKDKDKEKEKDKEKDINKNELELMAEKLNMFQSLFNQLNSLSGIGLGLDTLFKPKDTVEITSDILSHQMKNHSDTIVSELGEFGVEDIIKAYAYNSNQGNVRDYNEDTITISKINDFYFFGVYDGHGGNGCSIYLKDKLHTFIKDFSKESLIDAVNKAENTFISEKAFDSQKNIIDSSGSCGIMTIIKGNRCIIANVGDSRCVVFKNSKVHFATVDHKPNSDEEKERITKAGGKLYQTPTFFPLFQNGQKIEGPWRVFPGRLSVSRTFGDVEAKEESLGGIKGVVVALPDVTEIEITNEFNLIIIGCDGIFDVMSNNELLECAKIVLKEKKGYDINHLCGEIATMIIKSALAKDSFDNVSCIVIGINLDII